MTNNGRLVFGVYPGSVQTITRPRGYNNNQWHHVVASLGRVGMALYVDGARVASRTDVTTAQGYMGYWRVGGDSWARGRARRPARTSPAPSTTSRSTRGCCRAAEVQDHFARGQGQVTNEPPTADFNFSADDLDVAFDGTASTDPDGTISAYSWDFGDGQSSTASSPDHTYAAAGSYQVRLTVTDDDGDSDAVTKTVTVASQRRTDGGVHQQHQRAGGDVQRHLVGRPGRHRSPRTRGPSATARPAPRPRRSTPTRPPAPTR